jgi:hypothetical protein
MADGTVLRNPLPLNVWLNRGLPENIRIHLTVAWLPWLLPVILFNQFLAPHPVWIVLAVVISGIYSLGYLWVRSQVRQVSVSRSRLGTILVAGDLLQEEIEVRNDGRLPLFWVEFVDDSTVPGYPSGRVVACGAESFARWRQQHQCVRRGVYQLGPHHLRFADPFALFEAVVDFDYSDVAVIYPRVVQVPKQVLPAGDTSGVAALRRPRRGVLPAASVTDYRPGDSLRYVHWASTAHRNRLMVKELEVEPSGDIWIVLDLYEHAHSGADGESTLEYAVMMAASLAAEWLGGNERRAVGLLTTSSHRRGNRNDGSVARRQGEDGATSGSRDRLDGDDVVAVHPMVGSAQMWHLLATLAPVQPSTVPLAELLSKNHGLFGRRRNIFVITTDSAWDGISAQAVPPHAERALHEHAGANATQSSGSELVGQAPEVKPLDWIAALLQLQSNGLQSSVMLVQPADRNGEGIETDGLLGSELRMILAEQGIASQRVRAGTYLPAVLTFRRTRKVIRTTPTGGVIAYEVEEDVG